MTPRGFLVLVGKLLLPARCMLCGIVGLESLCTACAGKLELVGTCCLRCGRRRLTTYASPDCGNCHGVRLGAERLRSLFAYTASGRDLLTEFKFHRRLPAGNWLASQLGSFAQSGCPALFGLPGVQPHFVAAVPVHASRHRERGFNQSELLAQAVARSLRLPCTPGILVRTRATQPQFGLSAAQRQENVGGAFAVAPAWRGRLAGSCVLLVDDLLTTGATLRACALALRKAGCAQSLGLTCFSTLHEVESPAD